MISAGHVPRQQPADFNKKTATTGCDQSNMFLHQVLGSRLIEPAAWKAK